MSPAIYVLSAEYEEHEEHDEGGDDHGQPHNHPDQHGWKQRIIRVGRLEQTFMDILNNVLCKGK